MKRHTLVHVRFAPKATESLRHGEWTQCAKRRHHAHSFEHFVGAAGEGQRDSDAKQLGGLEVQE
jgi:hypothetical protein